MAVLAPGAIAQSSAAVTLLSHQLQSHCSVISCSHTQITDMEIMLDNHHDNHH
jgi:hypothetical protein